MKQWKVLFLTLLLIGGIDACAYALINRYFPTALLGGALIGAYVSLTHTWSRP